MSRVGRLLLWTKAPRTVHRFARVLHAAGKSYPDLVRMLGPEIDWDWVDVATELDGVCLEVSSAGLHKPHAKLYPNPELLVDANRRGTTITLASDAHIPQDVGRDLDRAIEHARSAGYDAVTVFDRRQARQEPLG